MALTEIDARSGRQLRTEFGRRRPWGALFARSGNNNTTTKGTYERSNTPMGPWPGEFLIFAGGICGAADSIFIDADEDHAR